MSTIAAIGPEIALGGGNSWQHNPQHRGGTPYSNKATANKFGGDSIEAGKAARIRSGGRQQAGATDRAAGNKPRPEQWTGAVAVETAAAEAAIKLATEVYPPAPAPARKAAALQRREFGPLERKQCKPVVHVARPAWAARAAAASGGGGGRRR